MKTYMQNDLVNRAKSAVETLGLSSSLRGLRQCDPLDIIEFGNQVVNNDPSSVKAENARLVIARIKALIKENDRRWSVAYPECDLVQQTIDVMDVFSGYYAFMLLKEQLFEIDFVALGFESFIEFIAVIGGYVSLKHNHSFYEAEYSWETEHPDGKHKLNRYRSCTHGDFRFVQYDVTPRSTPSPFCDMLEIFSPTYKTIAAYHSLEPMFLATIMRFSIEKQHPIPVLLAYDEFIAGISEEGSRLGNFGDAGMKTDFFIEPSLLDCVIPVIRTPEIRNWHSMPKESMGEVSAFNCDGLLLWTPDDVSFTIDDLDHLVIGLHKACQEGMGRTSLGNLESFVRLVLPKYLAGLGLGSEVAVETE